MYAIYRTEAGFKDNNSFVLFQGENRSIIALLERGNWDYKIKYITDCYNSQLSICKDKRINIINKQKELKEFLEDFKSKIPYNENGDKVLKPTLKYFKSLLMQ